MEIQHLSCLWMLWMLLSTQTVFVCGDLQFLERDVGDSVVFHCVSEERNNWPIAVYLKRKWLNPDELLFMLTAMRPEVLNSDYDERISVSGDPSTRQLNVTISRLRATDTDRYYCEFVIPDSAADIRIPGKTEFFLYVDEADIPGSVDIRHVEVCAGGSAVLPCLPPHGEGSVMEGVTLKRRRSQAPVQVLYHSKHHHNHLASSPSSSSPGLFPSERLVLTTAPSPNGMAYNLTLLQLQPEDTAFYSCQLLVPGRPDSSTSLGRHVFYVSVQGGRCGCTSYATLLYAMTSAVGILLIFFIGIVIIYRSKAHDRVKPQPQAPIYEEMVGVRPPNRKMNACHLAALHLEETDTSVSTNSPAKARLENPYEISHGALLNAAEEDQKLNEVTQSHPS